MILVVDHQDSFVYNLVQLIELLGEATEVVDSRLASAEELLALNPAAVLLSPGPGAPEDAGCFLDLLAIMPSSMPLLGVCLGHQALGVAFGGKVDRAPRPVHGKASTVHHDGTGLFAGVPDPFEAARYHSLVVLREEVPEDLRVTAWTDDDLVMGLEHRSLPRYGLQFHPESILTPAGPAIVQNFLTLAATRGPEQARA